MTPSPVSSARSIVPGTHQAGRSSEDLHPLKPRLVVPLKDVWAAQHSEIHRPSQVELEQLSQRAPPAALLAAGHGCSVVLGHFHDLGCRRRSKPDSLFSSHRLFSKKITVAHANMTNMNCACTVLGPSDVMRQNVMSQMADKEVARMKRRSQGGDSMANGNAKKWRKKHEQWEMKKRKNDSVVCL